MATGLHPEPERGMGPLGGGHCLQGITPTPCSLGGWSQPWRKGQQWGEGGVAM